MSEPYLGQIMIFGGNFAPRGWAFCDGQLLSINQNDALFSLLGTMYGGDGRSTFGLPDLRCRTPLHAGTGQGLSPRKQGAKFGEEKVIINEATTPNHTHPIQAIGVPADSTDPAGRQLAQATTRIYNDDTPDVNLNPAMVGYTGGAQSHTNMMPYLCVHFCIALFGVYPSRS